MAYKLSKRFFMVLQAFSAFKAFSSVLLSSREMFCSIFSSPDSDSQEKGHIHKVHLCLSVTDFIYLTVKPLLSSQSVPNFTPIAVKCEILSVQAECGSLDQRTASGSLYITLPKITHRVERKIIGKTHLALLSEGDDAQHLLFIGDPT